MMLQSLGLGVRRMTFVSSSRFEASRRGRIAGSRFNNVKRPAESKSASLDAWDAQLAVMRRRDPPQPMALRIALLIDAENITYKNVDGIMNEVEKLGVVQVRRIYADWTSEVMRGWRQTVLTNALTPIHQFQSSIGKGNSDSALIIDAMDILFKNKDIESFCIVSSDADFTRLATKLREEGKLVLGIGSNYTPAPFVVACNRFVYLHNLVKDEDGEDDSTAAAASGAAGEAAQAPLLQQQVDFSRKSSLPLSALPKPSVVKPSTAAPPNNQRHVIAPPSVSPSTTAASPSSTGAKLKPGQKLDLTLLPSSPAIKRSIVLDLVGDVGAEPELTSNNEKLLPLLTRAWSVVRQDSGWASAPHLTAELLRISPDLDASSFGKFTKLEDLFEFAVQGFEVKKKKNRVAHVRRIMAGRNEVALESAGFDDDVDGEEEQSEGEEVFETLGGDDVPTPTTTTNVSDNPTQVLPLLTRAWAVARLDSGWASYSHLQAELLKIAPEFEASRYGDILQLGDLLERDQVNFQVSKCDGKVTMVRRILETAEDSTTVEEKDEVPL
ncbi:hypothetical protein BASA81_000301 [Batrachochytrium salamandrivorans]|nr:hypothetical protein BASA81_000301 [Batrachochytrium salamandrivorans]